MNKGPLLSYEWVHPREPSDKCVVMLHGILGQKRNLFGFARRFVQRFERYAVLLCDLRNHGQSQGFQAPHTLQACAADLDRLLSTLAVEPRAVIGHSFGAGVSLAYAAHFGHPQSLWLLDALPGNQDLKETRAVLAALEGCPLPASKSEFEACLTGQGISEGIARWLAMNLREDTGRLRFCPDPKIAREMLADFKQSYTPAALEAQSSKGPIYMVKAEKSREWPPLMGRFHFFTLPNSGHWVHVDNPEGLLEMMAVDFA